MDILEILTLVGEPEYRVDIINRSTRAYRLNDDEWLWVTIDRGVVTNVEKSDRPPPD
jgi:hypothetical protein